MKKYVQPIVELNKFDAEDIIMASGVIMGYSDLSVDTQNLISAYQTETGKTTEASYVEFHW